MADEPATAQVRHVEPRARGWALREAGAEQADRLFASRSEAEQAALRWARERGGEVVVHDREGGVRERLRAG